MLNKMRSQLPALLGTCCIAFLLGQPINAVSAEELSVSVASHSSSMALPKNGMNKDSVSSRFGEPLQKIGAVGEPPISRWVYKDFTVYFEYDKVLHSVIHHK